MKTPGKKNAILLSAIGALLLLSGCGNKTQTVAVKTEEAVLAQSSFFPGELAAPVAAETGQREAVTGSDDGGTINGPAGGNGKNDGGTIGQPGTGGSGSSGSGSTSGGSSSNGGSAGSGSTGGGGTGGSDSGGTASGGSTGGTDSGGTASNGGTSGGNDGGAIGGGSTGGGNDGGSVGGGSTNGGNDGGQANNGGSTSGGGTSGSGNDGGGSTGGNDSGGSQANNGGSTGGNDGGSVGGGGTNGGNDGGSVGGGSNNGGNDGGQANNGGSTGGNDSGGNTGGSTGTGSGSDTSGGNTGGNTGGNDSGGNNNGNTAGNDNGGTGGSTGGSTGGNDGGTVGNNGGNTGGNDGGSVGNNGGNTGGNDGGNSIQDIIAKIIEEIKKILADNTPPPSGGGSPGGNTGGSTGGNDGGNTGNNGGNTGGNDGGNTGGNNGGNDGTDGGTVGGNPPNNGGNDGGDHCGCRHNPRCKPGFKVTISRVCSVRRSGTDYLFFEDATNPIISVEATVYPNNHSCPAPSLASGGWSSMPQSHSHSNSATRILIKKEMLSGVDLFEGRYTRAFDIDLNGLKQQFPRDWRNALVSVKVCDDSDNDGFCSDESVKRVLSLNASSFLADRVPSSMTIDVFNGRNLTRTTDAEFCEKQYSPIVLDLKGDGIKLTGPEEGVYFDLNDTGAKIPTGWTAAGVDDAFLVRDVNDNGKIDNGAELFGSATKLRSGARAANGFEAMKELDDNGDGVLDAADRAWRHLRLWGDFNHNGKSDRGEISTLKSAKVVSISLRYIDMMEVDPYGNQTRQRSTFRKQLAGFGLVPQLVIDVWFNTFASK